MKIEEIKGIIIPCKMVTRLTADEGKEIYNVSNPEVYGKTITLGIHDSPDNWAERDETVIEEEMNNLN